MTESVGKGSIQLLAIKELRKVAKPISKYELFCHTHSVGESRVGPPYYRHWSKQQHKIQIH